jgi:hypothetical protein
MVRKGVDGSSPPEGFIHFQEFSALRARSPTTGEHEGRTVSGSKRLRGRPPGIRAREDAGSRALLAPPDAFDLVLGADSARRVELLPDAGVVTQ